MKRAVTKERTMLGSESELLIVEGLQIRPTGATENAKGHIVRFFLKEKLDWGMEIKNLAWYKIDKACGCEESLIPKF